MPHCPVGTLLAFRKDSVILFETKIRFHQAFVSSMSGQYYSGVRWSLWFTKANETASLKRNKSIIRFFVCLCWHKFSEFFIWYKYTYSSTNWAFRFILINHSWQRHHYWGCIPSCHLSNALFEYVTDIFIIVSWRAETSLMSMTFIIFADVIHLVQMAQNSKNVVPWILFIHVCNLIDAPHCKMERVVSK